MPDEEDSSGLYLGWELIDEGEPIDVSDESRVSTIQKIKKYADEILTDKNSVDIIFEQTENFDKYFIKLGAAVQRSVIRKTVAILDDMTENDNDILFTVDGVHIIKKGKFKELVQYDDIEISPTGEEVYIGSKYVNENINIEKLVSLFEELSPDGELGVRENPDPLEFFQKMIKLPF